MERNIYITWYIQFYSNIDIIPSDALGVNRLLSCWGHTGMLLLRNLRLMLHLFLVYKHFDRNEHQLTLQSYTRWCTSFTRFMQQKNTGVVWLCKGTDTWKVDSMFVGINYNKATLCINVALARCKMKCGRLQAHSTHEGTFIHTHSWLKCKKVKLWVKCLSNTAVDEELNVALKEALAITAGSTQSYLLLYFCQENKLPNSQLSDYRIQKQHWTLFSIWIFPPVMQDEESTSFVISKQAKRAHSVSAAVMGQVRWKMWRLAANS